MDDPVLKQKGATWWHTEDDGSPTLSKASLGLFFFHVLKNGAQVGDIFTFNAKYHRSQVIVSVFMTGEQKTAIEGATPVRFRRPPKIKVN